MPGSGESLDGLDQTIRDDVKIKWQEVDGLDQTIRADEEIKCQEEKSH